MSELPEFKGFGKIPRIDKWGQHVIVTEKLDGTNGLIHIAADRTTITAGSRNRWLKPNADKKDDNFGFASWVEQNKEDLLKLGPGYHYGEWWGCGIGRGYGLHERRFSLFNVGRWGKDGPGHEHRPACCGTVPILYAGPWNRELQDQIDMQLRDNGSYAAPGYRDPEGWVLYACGVDLLFKRVFDKPGKAGRKGGERDVDNNPVAEAEVRVEA